MPALVSLSAATMIALAATVGATSVVIDDDFNDGVVTGWMGQGNTRTFSAHNISESGSVITSEVIPTQSDTYRGIVSTTSFNPSAEAGGFTMSFLVASQGPPAPGANGTFIGAVGANTDFFRNLDNFGLTFFGTDSRTGSGGGFGLIYGDNNGTNPSDFVFGNSDAQGDVELASFQDGFSATIDANLSGWSYLITGLSNAAGTPATFSDSGTWTAAGTSFAALFAGDTSWFATGGSQGPGAAAGLPTHSIAFDRITVTTIPEPTPAILVVACLGGLALRRHRKP